MNQNYSQPGLFDAVEEIDSPLPGHDQSAELENERELVEEAFEYVKKNLLKKQPSVAEFVFALTNEFGDQIKKSLVDLAQKLNNENFGQINNEYIATHLTDENFNEALKGEKPKTLREENTLDELFARSSIYRSSTKFIEMVDFVSRFREYAPFNNMMVYLQRPTATYWATASHWEKEFERTIKEDAIPLIMLQPMGPIMLAYDIEDTIGPPLPDDLIEPFAVEGDFDEKIYYKTLDNCPNIGIALNFKRLSSLHAGSAIRSPGTGNTKITIKINDDLNVPARFATLCHELAHILLGHLGGDPKGKEWGSRLGLSRNQRELEAEAVSYIVCVRTRLISKSAEYLAGYLKNPKLLNGISVDLILKTAGYIEKMGKQTIYPRPVKEKK